VLHCCLVDCYIVDPLTTRFRAGDFFNSTGPSTTAIGHVCCIHTSGQAHPLFSVYCTVCSRRDVASELVFCSNSIVFEASTDLAIFWPQSSRWVGQTMANFQPQPAIRPPPINCYVCAPLLFFVRGQMWPQSTLTTIDRVGVVNSRGIARSALKIICSSRKTSCERHVQNVSGESHNNKPVRV
jgi:hypothetical protein